MFAISTDGCRTIHTYDQAKQRYESIEPIRGSNNIRPYGKRSKRNLRISEGTMDGVHYYAAILYVTECVRWFADGRVQVRTGGYATVSTSKFISAVAPFDTLLFDNHLWVKRIPVADGEVGLTFKYNENREWVCLNLPTLYTKHLNKAETKRLRDLPVVKTVQEYLKNMKALGAWDNKLVNTNSINLYKVRLHLRNILTEYETNPNYEPPLEVLAVLGEWSHGPISFDLLYQVCNETLLTDDAKLYNRRDVPIGTMKKGVCCA